MAGEYASPPQPMPAKPGEGSNIPGLLGFILSLIAFFTCGSLAPVALILSVIGMRQEPKGLAIAGLILSILGCIGLLAVAIFYASLFALLASCAGISQMAIEDAEKMAATKNAIRSAETEIDNYYDINGEYPDDATGNGIVEQFEDGWENELRYERTEDSYDIRSAGRDGEFDTYDDKTLEELDLFEEDDEDFDWDDGADADAATDGVDLDSIPFPDDGNNLDATPQLPLDGAIPPDANDAAPMGAAA